MNELFILKETTLKIRTLSSWLLATVLCLSFLASGYPKIAAGARMVERFAAWGYPAWFCTLVGSAEIAGAVLVLIPALASYGAIVIAAVMAGAIFTHLTTGIGSPAFAAAYLVLALLLAWLRYPRSLRGRN